MDAIELDLAAAALAAASPNRLGLTDVTEHHTREGTLYCCVVLELLPRWSSAG